MCYVTEYRHHIFFMVVQYVGIGQYKYIIRYSIKVIVLLAIQKLELEYITCIQQSSNRKQHRRENVYFYQEINLN